MNNSDNLWLAKNHFCKKFYTDTRSISTKWIGKRAKFEPAMNLAKLVVPSCPHGGQLDFQKAWGTNRLNYRASFKQVGEKRLEAPLPWTSLFTEANPGSSIWPSAIIYRTLSACSPHGSRAHFNVYITSILIQTQKPFKAHSQEIA